MVNAPPAHIFSVLDQALKRLRTDLLAVGAGPELRALLGDLRTSQIRLLSLVPEDGMRLTDLAQRVGMSKQALGEFADVLQSRGLLETLRDPADRRARVVRRTALGDAAAQTADAAIVAMEQRWRDQVGAERWDTMTSVLREIAASPLDP